MKQLIRRYVKAMRDDSQTKRLRERRREKEGGGRGRGG